MDERPVQGRGARAVAPLSPPGSAGTPVHTALAREALGSDKLLVPKQSAILENDPVRARKLGRAALAHYQSYPNFQNNWRRLGFSEEEISWASDRLVDALFA